MNGINGNINTIGSLSNYSQNNIPITSDKRINAGCSSFKNNSNNDSVILKSGNKASVHGNNLQKKALMNNMKKGSVDN